MSRTQSAMTKTFTAILALAALSGCQQDAFAPEPLDVQVLYAKGGGGGPPGGGVLPAEFTINSTTSLLSDGLGVYRDGENGVVAVHQDGDLATFAPTAGRCRGGCEPRSATVVFECRHNTGHIDEVCGTPFSEDLGNMKVRLEAETLLLNLVYCSWEQTNPKKKPAGYGLRFNPGFLGDDVFPESSWVDVAEIGTDSWTVESFPWPDNIAGCQKGTRDNPTTEYWHMDVSFDVEVTG